jgi:hypothetical protein
MSFLDKVKEQAAVATAAAKDAAQKGQAKLDDLQSKRAADGLLRDLGAAYYALQTGRSASVSDADLTRLVNALREHEATHGALSLAPEGPASNGGASSPSSTGTPAADTTPPSGQTL